MTRQSQSSLLVTSVILIMASTGILKASPSLYGYNCTKILQLIEDTPTPSNEPELYLIARSHDVVLPEGNDIMDAIEDSAENVLEGVIVPENGNGVVGCALIAVGFRDPSKAGGNWRSISDNAYTQPKGDGRELLPIILMRRFNEEAFHDYYLGTWENNKFNIGLLARDDPATEEKEPAELGLTEPGVSVPFKPYLLWNIMYLGTDYWLKDTEKTEKQFKVISLNQVAREEFTELFVPIDSEISDKAVIICGSEICDDLWPTNGAASRWSQNSSDTTTYLPANENSVAETSDGNTILEAQIAEGPGDPLSSSIVLSTSRPPVPRSEADEEEGDTVFEFKPQTESVEIGLVTDSQFEGTLSAASGGAVENEVVTEPGDQQSISSPPLNTSSSEETAPTQVAMQINLTVVGGDSGELNDIYIACLLEALGAQIGNDLEYQCGEMVRNADPEPLLILDEPTNWRLELRAPSQPRQIIVTLPMTVQAQTCVIDVKILNESGDVETIIPLEGPADLSIRGAMFKGSWPENSMPQKREVTISLEPHPNARCGGPARTLTVPAAEVIEVALLPAGTTLPALEIAHITAFQSKDLITDFDLDIQLQDLLSDQILAATAMAHVHLGRSVGTGNSLISAGVFGRIGSDGRLSKATFTAAELEPISNLTQTVYQGYEKVGFSHTASSNQYVIMRSIIQLAREAEARGATALHVNLFGPVLTRSTMSKTDLNTICDDLRLTQELELRDLPIPTTVTAFPLVAKSPEDRFDIANLVPTALPSGAERMPSGLMRCIETEPKVAILPYFVETWRSPRDLPGRYATTIGNYLAAALISKVAELEGQK